MESRYAQVFELIPYANDLPTINITGEVAREKNQLSIHYNVTGDIDQILLPAQSPSSRQDDLWKATCFEFFLAVPDQPQYWEFNLSPSGNWNVYIMNAYRRVGFREEKGISELPFGFRKNNSNISVDVSVGLTPIISPIQNIQVGITAIIQKKDGSEIYFSLAHTGSEADFHLRKDFIIHF